MFGARIHHGLRGRRQRTIPRAGLDSYYDFLQRSDAQVLYDISGNARNGQLGATAGADATDPAWSAQTLAFAGGQYVNLDTAGQVYDAGYTIAVVIKGAAQSARQFYSEGNAASDDPFIYLSTGSTGTSKLRIVIRESAAAIKLSVESAAVLFDDGWHLVVFTDNEGAYTIYIDGETPESATYTQGSLTLDRATIGAIGRIGYGSYFTGSVGAVLRWRRAITATEYAKLRAALRRSLAGHGIQIPTAAAEEEPAEASRLVLDSVIASGTWTCPAGVTSALVECWGGGGGADAGQGAGGGAAYAGSTIAVTPAADYDVVVGAGGAAGGTDGGDSSFAPASEAAVVVAKGGKGGGANGGTGGLASESTGTTKYAGGDGQQGTGNQNGAGAAGSTAAGGVISIATGGDNEGGYGGSANANNNGAYSHLLGGGGRCRSAGTVETAGMRGEVRVTYTLADAAGYPAVQARSWNRSNRTAATSHVITMPSGIVAGELLLLIVGANGSAATLTVENWTKLGQGTQGNTHLAVFHKTAAGADTATLAATAAVVAWHAVYRISAATVEGTFANDTTTPSDPPSHTSSAGAVNHLWIAATSRGTGSDNINPGGAIAAPTGYGSKLTVSHPDVSTSWQTVGVGVIAERMVPTAATEDPAAFTGGSTSTSIRDVSVTLAIR